MPALALNPSLVLAPTDDGYLAFDAATGRVHHLNPTAALMVELCDGTRATADVLALVAPLLDARGRDESERWVESALRDGMILMTSGATAPADRAKSRWTASSLAAKAEKLSENGSVLAAFICQSRAAELDPDNPDRWYQLGDHAQSIGRRAVARDAYARYAARHPEDAEIEQILYSLRDDAPPDRASDRCITQIYQRFASSYENCMIDELEYRAPEHLAEALARVVEGRRDLDVLDLGCGTGLFAPKLRPLARHLLGLDLSPAMLARARARGLFDQLETAEMTAWLRDTADRFGPFDLIAACDSLIYFGDLHQVIVPAASRLRPGGVMAFTLEHHATPPFRLTDTGRFAHHEDHVAEVAADAGLRVVHLDRALLRYEYGEPVTGLVAVLRAPA
jgi:predicted TPR repeat methyltransferase